MEVFDSLSKDVIPGETIIADMKYQAAEIEAETFEHIMKERLVINIEPLKDELYEKHEKIKKLSKLHIQHEKHIGPEDLEAAEALSILIRNTVSVSRYISDLSSEDTNNDVLIKNLIERFHRVHGKLEDRLNHHLSVHQEELSSGQIIIDRLHQSNVKTIWIYSIGISLLVLVIGIIVDRFYILHSRKRDITEDRLQEKTYQLTEAAEHAKVMALAAKQASQAKSEFLANMSHEIRTPMNAILGFTEIMERKVEDTEQKGYLHSISASGKTLLRIIDDILDLSKLEAGRIELHYSATNPYTLFSEIEKIFSLKVEEKGLEFRSDVDASLPDSLILDEIRLRQILINLVGNAVKFTEKGYIRLSVRQKYSDRGRSKLDLIVSVQDTGIGIPEDQQKEIFKAFTQQDGRHTAKFGGTGLGLSISKRLAALMGGEISLESTVGGGSVFFITLNDIAVGSVSDAIDRNFRLDLDTVVFEKATVLVVDDVETNIFLMTSFFQIFDFNLLTARNGSDAVSLAKQHLPDLILMDMKMPVMDGYEAVEILKNNETTRSIPIIAVTASALKTAEERVQDAGCDGYLTKPISRQKLVEEIIRHLPYSTRNVSKIQAESGAGRGALSDTLLPETIGRLPELISIVEDELMPQWSKIHKRLIVREIREFADRIRALGQDYSLGLLTGFGEEVLIQAKSFDAEKLSGMMNTFPEMVRKIGDVMRKEGNDSEPKR